MIPLKFGVPEVEVAVGVWLDCLCLAVHERYADIARLLVGAGADVTMNTWNTLHSLYGTGSHISPSNFDMLLILHDRGKNRVPITMAADLLWDPFCPDDAWVLFSCEGSIRWGFPSFRSVQQTIGYAVHFPEPRFLLRQPARSRDERIYKAVCLQMALVQLCLGWHHIQEPAPLLLLLLEEGASIHGWTWKRASAMMQAWRQLAAMSDFGTETHHSDVSWQLAASKRSICTVVSEDGRKTVYLCRLLHQYFSCLKYVRWVKPCDSICPLAEPGGEWRKPKSDCLCINGPCDLSPFSRLCIQPAVLCRNNFHATEKMVVLFLRSKVVIFTNITRHSTDHQPAPNSRLLSRHIRPTRPTFALLNFRLPLYFSSSSASSWHAAPGNAGVLRDTLAVSYSCFLAVHTVYRKLEWMTSWTANRH